MTAELVNLNKVRKARARAEDAKRAQENRLRYGKTLAERKTTEHARQDMIKTLDGAELTPPRLDESHDDLDPGTVS
ncbi:MAG: hypothetical protein CTY31_09880 [Hyphomicrobium sp.]|nr:MAG: hypothetical protein CTY31_09880 [Hyphomicrobium sp.]